MLAVQSLMFPKGDLPAIQNTSNHGVECPQVSYQGKINLRSPVVSREAEVRVTAGTGGP